MKLLATIKSVKVIRQYQRQDGTFGNIFGVTIQSGDDELIAETFLSKEGQQRRGIVPGAIGTAQVETSVRIWNDKQGAEHQTQEIRLKDFALANRNIPTESPTTAEPTPADVTAAIAEDEEKRAKAEEAQEAQINPDTNLPF